MSKRVLCKFFANGTCFKGEYCEFSHDWKDQSNNICIFYQKGRCTYGSRCRYEHVKLSRSKTSAPSSSSSASLYSRSHMASSSVQATCPSASPNGHIKPDLSSQAQHANTSKPLHSPSNSAWMLKQETSKVTDNMNGHHPVSASLADQPICSFAAAGSCPLGETCPQIHGDLCSTCGKHCLHPYRPAEREEHLKVCEKNSKYQEALRRSQEIECCVCLDRVLSKPVVSERKFGILSECDHSFCISCIRNWRSNSPASGMDVNTALRACPVCRKHSYFVIPSVIWYSSQEEKQEIVDSYKKRLRSIDCKHFDFGNGMCPFGTSCFYRHNYKPHASRPRPRTYRPHRYRPRPQTFIDEDLMDLAARLVIQEELENLEDEDAYGLLEHLDDEDAYGLLEHLEDEDADSLLEMAFWLMHMGMDDQSSTDDDED